MRTYWVDYNNGQGDREAWIDSATPASAVKEFRSQFGDVKILDFIDVTDGQDNWINVLAEVS